MVENEDIRLFFNHLQDSIARSEFVKITISKNVGSERTLQKILGRIVQLKNTPHLSLTYRFATQDEVKNFGIKKGILHLQSLVGTHFLQADLFTTQANVHLFFSKKRKTRLLVKKPTHTVPPSQAHNRPKNRLLQLHRQSYLQEMDVLSASGEILKKGQKKIRQLNKYLEIIDNTLRQYPLRSRAHIVDMGAGKGYLTFALYDFLTQQGMQPQVVGIELRPHLVQKSNKLAATCGFDQLSFIAQDIMAYQAPHLDMLIALHACDTATDLAIAKGIQNDAAIIMVAPCCHKQVRKDMQAAGALEAVLKHGILEERQAEILTDGIRALLLEAHGYQTKVFEFIETEHTPKNVLIVATKTKTKKNPQALEIVAQLKTQFGIKRHFLEEILTR